LNILDADEEIKDQIDQDNYFSPMVVTDPYRVMQVLLCLQSNALKFTKRGYVRISVSIVNQHHRRKVVKFLRINVRDSGVGIPEEDQDKLFKLFGFIENKNSAMNSKGIGLGLVIAK
jgi:signal transduction histidine kinase